MESLDIELQPVASSNIAAYNRSGNELVIQFLGKGERDSDDEIAGRRAYKYTALGDDDRAILDAFEAAESKGRYFISHIRPTLGGTQVTIPRKVKG